MTSAPLCRILQFLSTPSARRATKGHCIGDDYGCISIHALREEGDYTVKGDMTFKVDFYPRPPRGGRRAMLLRRSCGTTISIHALREEGDQ